jgi:ABC-type polysaccharide/polyol phosphate export permease
MIPHMLAGLIQYRGFIWRHAWADLRFRYAGTGMGLAWNVVHPLAIIAIYSIVFTRVFKPQDLPQAGPLAYTFYLCSGFFPWIAFCECVTRGCGSFQANAQYLKKLPIPEQVFVAKSAATSTVSLFINFLLLLMAALLLGWSPAWCWLLLPIPLLLLQSLGFATGLLLGTLNVFFRDIAEWLAIALQVLMWTVPIVYRLSPVPAWLGWHPLMPALSAIRALFLDRRLPAATDWAGMILWLLLATLAASFVLRKLRPEIRDLI